MSEFFQRGGFATLASSWSSEPVPKSLVYFVGAYPCFATGERPSDEIPFQSKHVSTGALFTSADELDAFTRKARGGDAAGEIRRLEDTLKRLREDLRGARKLATAAEEAAAKCQVGSRAFFVLPLSFSFAFSCVVVSLPSSVLYIFHRCCQDDPSEFDSPRAPWV